MSAIRNSNVANGYITNTDIQLVYEVPTGFNFILKSVIVHQTSGQQSAFAFSFISNQSGVNLEVANSNTDPVGNFSWTGWTVLNSGDIIRMKVLVPTVAFWIAGALLPFAPGL